MLTIAKDGWAHVVLMAALTFTDDTALLRKYILQDLLVRCMHVLSLTSYAMPAQQAAGLFFSATPST